MSSVNNNEPLTMADFLENHVEETLAAYCAQPARLEEDWRVEQQVVSGGYGHRQVIELIQNGADEIKRGGKRGKVHVVLTDSTFYCANEGRALTQSGLRALLMANMSDKVEDEIGRFGLGFKSILTTVDFVIRRSDRLFARTSELKEYPITGEGSCVLVPSSE